MSTEILVSVVWATRPFPLPAFQGFEELAIEALLTSRPRKATLFLHLYTAASEASGHPQALFSSGAEAGEVPAVLECLRVYTHSEISVLGTISSGDEPLVSLGILLGHPECHKATPLKNTDP